MEQMVRNNREMFATGQSSYRSRWGARPASNTRRRLQHVGCAILIIYINNRATIMIVYVNDHELVRQS